MDFLRRNDPDDGAPENATCNEDEGGARAHPAAEEGLALEEGAPPPSSSFDDAPIDHPMTAEEVAMEEGVADAPLDDVTVEECGGDKEEREEAQEGPEGEEGGHQERCDEEGDDHEDEDSEYTYVTDDEEEPSRKKRGWFGFLRRGKGAKEDDSEKDEEDIDVEAGNGNDEGHYGGDHGKEDVMDVEENFGETGEDASSGEEDYMHHLLNTPPSAKCMLEVLSPDAIEEAKKKEEEEALLMDQAIQRVQDRIQANGGDLYGALSEQDKKLVDSLRGNADAEEIRKLVARTVQRENRPIEKEGRDSCGVEGKKEGEDTPVGPPGPPPLVSSHGLPGSPALVNVKEDVSVGPSILPIPPMIPHGLPDSTPGVKVNWNIVGGPLTSPPVAEVNEASLADASGVSQTVFSPQQPQVAAGSVGGKVAHDQGDDGQVPDLIDAEPTTQAEPSAYTKPSLTTTNETTPDLRETEGEKPPVEPAMLMTTVEESEPTKQQQMGGRKQRPTPAEQGVHVVEEVDGNSESAPSENEEEDDSEDEEQPTPEEQRSLLSLAAEHDRVDVIKELLQDSEIYESLLAGISHSDNYEQTGEESALFVPPPLHAAVAHGSVNAASCLLRMGADPSIRPVVPLAYLSHGRQSTPSKPSGIKEDRNFKKYHGMSAWELAFGYIVVVPDGDGTNEEAAVGDEAAKEEVAPKRGWFGFGGEKKEETPHCDDAAAPTGGSSKLRMRKKLPLNIPPAKLDGIRHAFTAEALRAVGSDEEGRLRQLLNAGMDSSTELGGKTLVTWAREMDAKACCELLSVGGEDELHQEDEKDVDAKAFCELLSVGGEDETHQEDEKDVADVTDMEAGKEAVVNNVGSCGQNGDGPIVLDGSSAVEPTAQQQPTQPALVQDERLAGLSLADVQTLVRESETLIPPLTSVLKDLTAEVSISHSILRDIEATGGRGGLSSQALLELVRSLKDQRARADEARGEWQRAWEEREDELDFFWEEVLNEEMRNALGPALDKVEVANPAQLGVLKAFNNTSSSIAEWTKRFVEADGRVFQLRETISSLAEENSLYAMEIESHGMGGALSLTRSLREEIKEAEKNLNLAMAGEELCRRRIEIIQQQLGHDPAAEEGRGSSQQGYYLEEAVQDYVMENQLQGSMQQQKQSQRESGEQSSAPSPLVSVETGHAQVNDRATLTPEAIRGGCQVSAQEGGPHTEVRCEVENEFSSDNNPAIFAGDNLLDDAISTYDKRVVVEDCSSVEEETMIGNDNVGSNGHGPSRSESVRESISKLNNITNEAEVNIEEAQDEVFCASSVVMQEVMVQEAKETERAFKITQNLDENAMNGTSISTSNADTNIQTAWKTDAQPSAAPAQTTNHARPSETIADGISTAIVVHSQNVHADSFSSQIWDILRRIVGLGRVAPAPSSESYHDVHENHPHIFIV